MALAAADAGYDVAIHARAIDPDVRSLGDEIQARGVHALVRLGDLADIDSLPDLLAPTGEGDHGRFTLLVNNASLFEDDRIGTLTGASLDQHLAANLRAPILLAQAFAAQVPVGTEALIVNILDQRVWKPTPQFFSYAVSKAALWEATRMMAQALAPGIRVNGIGPGPTLANSQQSPEEFAAEVAGALLQRGPDVEEIGAALRYLIDARSVTGQMIAVDGGQHLGWRTPDIAGP